jgi:hypothetical protein
MSNDITYEYCVRSLRGNFWMLFLQCAIILFSTLLVLNYGLNILCILSTLGLFGSIYGLEKNHQFCIRFDSKYFGRMNRDFKFIFLFHAIIVYWLVHSYIIYVFFGGYIALMAAEIFYYVYFSRRLRQLKKMEEEFKRLENYESD